MTRRFGYWIIGIALGLVPLSGCALWGRGSANTSPDGSQAKAYVDQHQVVQAGPVIPFPRMENTVQPEREIQAPKDEAQSLLKNAPPPQAIEKLPPLPVPAANDNTDTTPIPSVFLPAKADRVETKKPAPTQADTDSREPVVEALSCLMDNRHNEALQSLGAYDQPTQEVFLRLLPMVKLLAQKSIDQWSATEVTLFDEEMKGLSESLRPRSEFTIGEACFCDSIESYGIYKRLPEEHAFLGSTPGRPGEKALLYVELRNFISEFKDSYFATWFESTLEIRNQDGKQIWFYRGFEEEKEPIQSRTRLHDFCNKYRFFVPNCVPPGNYTLTIEVTDKTRPNQPRVASKTLPFRVTAMPGRAP